MSLSATYYLNAPSFASATAVFTDAALTTLAADGFYSDGVISREQVLGVLLPAVTCPYCIAPFSSTVMDATSAGACALTQNSTYYFISVLGVATVSVFDSVFSDASGTIPLAAGFYYAFGFITGGFDWIEVNASGVVITTGTCSAPPSTARFDWTLGAQSGGQLIMLNSSMVEVLNETSSAGGARSGTIYVALADCPCTIRGEWVSGSGNVIHYNICDITGGGQVYASGAINISTPIEDYLLNPTPLWSKTNLRANGVMPPSCVPYTTWMANGGISYPDNATACLAATGGAFLYTSLTGMVTGATQFFSDTALTIPFNGNGLIWSISLGPSFLSKYATTIDNTGLVTAYSLCP